MSPSFSRRDFLKLGGVALGSSVAGCSSRQSSASNGIRIVRAYVINTVDRDFDVAVHLLDGDETAYWKTVRADADPPELQTGGVTLQDIPETPGEYVASARLVDVPEADPVTYDLAAAAREHDASCARIRLLIRNPKDEGLSLSFRTSDSDEFWSCDPNAT